MGRKPALDTHPQIDEIRRAILDGRESQEQLAQRFGVTRSAIRWYMTHKVEPELKEMAKSSEVKKVAASVDTIEILDEIISHYQDALDSANLTQIIKALELRSRITGEDVASPRIEIVWGHGLDINKIEGARANVKSEYTETEPTPDTEKDS